MIVVDASALLEALLSTAREALVTDILFDQRDGLHAPHLLDIEVTQVIRRYVLNGEIGAEHALTALADFLDLPFHRHPHHFLLPRVWELRNNLTAYDALYIALAEVLDAPLLTHDRRLAAAGGHRARIELI